MTHKPFDLEAAMRNGGKAILTCGRSVTRVEKIDTSDFMFKGEIKKGAELTARIKVPQRVEYGGTIGWNYDFEELLFFKNDGTLIRDRHYYIDEDDGPYGDLINITQKRTVYGNVVYTKYGIEMNEDLFATEEEAKKFAKDKLKPIHAGTVAIEVEE
jgi:hypothetical protein